MKRWLLLTLCLVLPACGGDDAEPSGGAGNLDAMIDSVMPRLQVLAGLKQQSEVVVQLQNRDSLRKYIETRMEQELPADELEGIRRTYVALGLLPDTLNVHQLLLDLYTEQVVGYYDPDSKKLYVVEGGQPETVKPVLVHELVHALQDQHVNLDSLVSRDRGNDRQTAAQSAVEGHATMVMVAYLAEAQSNAPVDPRSLPDVASSIRPALEQQNEALPVFRRAPRILRETLLFPYAGGAGFVHKLWVRPLETGFGDPYPAPFGDLLPQSTEQVLQPETKFLVERDDPAEIAIATTSAASIRENVIGQLELSILLEEHLGVDAKSAARGWDGDRYRLVNDNGKDVLLWFSVWDDAASADRFANAYRQVGAKRGRTVSVERVDISGRPGVRIIDPATASLSTASATVK